MCVCVCVYVCVCECRLAYLYVGLGHGWSLRLEHRASVVGFHTILSQDIYIKLIIIHIHIGKCRIYKNINNTALNSITMRKLHK